MKELWNNIWNFLNGKKVLIGLFLLWICDKVWFKDILPDGTIENATLDILAVIGGLLAGIGVIHKGIKGFEKLESKPHE